MNWIIGVITAPPAEATSTLSWDQQVAQSRQEAMQARAAEIEAMDDRMLVPMILFGVIFIPFFFYAMYRVYIVRDWTLGRSTSGSGSSSSSSSSSSSGSRGGGGGASDGW